MAGVSRVPQKWLGWNFAQWPPSASTDWRGGSGCWLLFESLIAEKCDGLSRLFVSSNILFFCYNSDTFISMCPSRDDVGVNTDDVNLATASARPPSEGTSFVPNHARPRLFSP